MVTVADLLETYFGETPMELDSPHSLNDSVKLLRDSSIPGLWGAVLNLKDSVVGVVSPSKVSLRRFLPINGNRISVPFHGTFIEKSRGVALLGAYRLPRLVTAFVLFFSTVALSLGPQAIVHAARNSSGWQAWAGPIIILLVGLYLPFRVHSLYRKDIAWMNNYFKKVLL